MTMEHNQICIVGFGGRTPVGSNALSTVAAVRAGISMFVEHPYLIDKSGRPMVVAMDTFLTDEITEAERFAKLGLSAAKEIMSNLSNTSVIMDKIRIIIGLPAERPGMPINLEDCITESFSNNIKEFVDGQDFEFFRTGRSAGLMALEEGWSRIRRGSDDIYLVGGIESYLEPDTLEWLDESDLLHSETNSWGFIPGEAASFCLLCSKREADRLGLKVFGQVLAVATELEYNVKTDKVCVGEGLTKAVKRVLQVWPSLSTQVDHIICDLNGEPYRAEEFGYTLVRTGDRFVDPTDFMTPADCWGDIGAASGPLFLILQMIAGVKGNAKGPHTLALTSSESGERSAALLQTVDVPEVD